MLLLKMNHVQLYSIYVCVYVCNVYNVYNAVGCVWGLLCSPDMNHRVFGVVFIIKHGRKLFIPLGWLGFGGG